MQHAEDELVFEVWEVWKKSTLFVDGFPYLLSFLFPFYSSEKSRNELVDALESVTYLICKEDDITLDIFYEVRLDAVIV